MGADFYIKNRATLFAEAGVDAIVLAGNGAVQKAADTSYPFQQEANFLYVTGIAEAGWFLCIEKDGTETLFAPEFDATYHTFNGGLSREEVQQSSGVQRIMSGKELPAALKSLAKKYTSIGILQKDRHESYYEFSVNPAQLKLRRDVARLNMDVIDIRATLMALRAIKQSAEIAILSEAASRTVESFERVKAAALHATNERELAALLSHDFIAAGGVPAYDSIVAAGANACTLHYVRNAAPLIDGEFVLIDAAAALQGYAADVTRTYRIGSKEPSVRQRAVHDAVVRAQQAIVQLIRPGVSIRSYIQQADDIMRGELASLGLLQSEDDFHRYFPHAVSHGLGLDVHESLGGYEVFRPGMVLTVEPGIYIPEEGIGVRIEDDILVTASGHENLSGALQAGY